MIKEWRKLVGTIYSVSNDGEFRNDKRGRIKTQTPCKHGYLTVNLHSKTYQAHRVVAKVFLPSFSEDLTVCHLNHDRRDNRAENLMMATIGDNIRQSARDGRLGLKGERNNSCRHSDELFFSIKGMINEKKFSDTEIAKHFGVNRHYVNMLKLGKVR